MQLKTPKPFHYWIYDFLNLIFPQIFSNKKILTLPSQTSWKQIFTPINWKGNFALYNPNLLILYKKQVKALWWWGHCTKSSLVYSERKSFKATTCVVVSFSCNDVNKICFSWHLKKKKLIIEKVWLGLHILKDKKVQDCKIQFILWWSQMSY
jgi:hypothetical protein